MLQQTINRLTALAEGSTVNADAKSTWAEIISENHRLHADKSRLFRQLYDVQTSLRAENRQLSKMVYFLEHFITGLP